MINTMEPMVTTLTGSSNATIPMTAVSTAPMPTHTAYAGPTGSVLRANIRPAIEAMINTKNATDGQSFDRPSDAFSDNAQPASSTPEITSPDEGPTTLFDRAVTGHDGVGPRAANRAPSATTGLTMRRRDEGSRCNDP